MEHETYAKSICLDCHERFVCTYCVHRNHKDHAKETIERYAPDTRNWIMSQISVAQDSSQQMNVSNEEMIKIKSFRTVLENELQDRVIKKLSNYIDRLIQEKEVLLNKYDTTVFRYQENITNSNLLSANTADTFAEFSKEMKNKPDFEILSERNAIIKKIDNLSIEVHSFEANLKNLYNEEYLLGELNVKTENITKASENKPEKNVELHMERVFEKEIEKENDLKSVMEYVSGK